MQKFNKVILSTAYFPPIQYFSKLLNYDIVMIEQYENYTKQSYRNRFEILSPNGKQTLSIPIEKISGKKQTIKDVKIDYSNDWQSIHYKSIETAYFSSPFFEYYIDAFMKFFEKKTIYLFDHNIEIIQTLLNELQISKSLIYSESYRSEYNFNDFRNTIHPKKKLTFDNSGFKAVQYTQVFYNKFKFIPNLSVLDLLFNEGPNTENILMQTFQL